MYQSHKFTSRYGSLFEGIEIRNKWSAAFYLIFMLRRILLVVIAFEAPEFDVIQLMYLLFLNLAILIYTG
tara:strand:+ start:28 stop:237 length:210 start_codon:yes stop_codon:yes gene_type:complete